MVTDRRWTNSSHFLPELEDLGDTTALALPWFDAMWHYWEPDANNMIGSGMKPFLGFLSDTPGSRTLLPRPNDEDAVRPQLGHLVEGFFGP